MVRRIIRRCLANARSSARDLGRLDQDFPARRDLHRLVVQEGLVIDVFWKSRAIGKGPALSVFVCGDEFATCDCFGPRKGHFYLALLSPGPPRHQRLEFVEASVSDQIRRTMAEIEQNLGYYVESAGNPAIRKFQVGQGVCARCCRKRNLGYAFFCASSRNCAISVESRHLIAGVRITDFVPIA